MSDLSIALNQEDWSITSCVEERCNEHQFKNYKNDMKYGCCSMFYYTWSVKQEGRKEMFYLTTHSTHFSYGYMASDVIKDHSDSEKGNPLPPHRLLFPISSNGSFICIIPHTG